MKKIMFLLAFVSMGIFASASDGKVRSIKSLVKKEVRVLKKESPDKIYAFSVDCGGTNIFFGCCYDTQAAAMIAALNWMWANCTAPPAPGL